jgi:MFS family permease
MLVTFSVMGIGLLGIGVDPSFASVGITSVVFLFIFRALFGLGLGGEFGGGVSWLVEYAAKSKWRAFWTLWSQPSTIGSAVSAFSFSLLAALYGKNFLTFGWRVPFYIATLLILFGIIIRYSLQESPLFNQLQQRNEVEKAPAKMALKENWKGIMLLGGTLLFIVTPGGALQAIFGTSYLVARGLTASFATFSAAIGASVGSVFLIIGALSGDLFGRKKTFLFSSVIMIVALIVYLPLLSTLNPSLIYSAQIFEQAAAGIGIPMTSVIFAEYFPTRYRYSASGLSFQFGNLFFGIIVTFIMPLIIAISGGVLASTFAVTALMVASALISLVCILFLRETKGDKMAI